MPKAYRLTTRQWQGLTDRQKGKFPQVGAHPLIHTNYHLCACIDAIQVGITLPDCVYLSYPRWTQVNCFDVHIRRTRQLRGGDQGE